VANAHRISQACGILLRGRKTRHPGGNALPNRQTWSRQTIVEACRRGQQAGLPEHVYDVLGLIMAADPTQLFADVIEGVSYWAITNRITTAEVSFLIPAFQQIDIKAIRADVQRHRVPMRPAQIAFIVSGIMEPALRSIRQ